MSDIKSMPVAWGLLRKGAIVDCVRGAIIDCISPEEHTRAEGGYTIPLYTADAIRAAVLAERERWVSALTEFAAGHQRAAEMAGDWDGAKPHDMAAAVLIAAVEDIRKEPT